MFFRRDQKSGDDATAAKISRLLAPARLRLLLWLLLVLFCLRVVGQMLVAFGEVSWLPPMEAWHSGLLPYSLLLASQFIIIGLYSKICLDFTRQQGFFYSPRRRLGQGLFIVGAIYGLVMGIRFIFWLNFHQGPWWMGGTIPIFFHWVLAGFILLVGSYHWFNHK